MTKPVFEFNRHPHIYEYRGLAARVFAHEIGGDLDVSFLGVLFRHALAAVPVVPLSAILHVIEARTIGVAVTNSGLFEISIEVQKLFI